MSYPFEKGQVKWARSEILAAIPEFLKLYSERPIQDNQGGMKAPHMFATWFMAQKLSPRLIVESGVFRGQSTWLFEVACPQARIISIDLNLDFRKYISPRVEYSDLDFTLHDWSEIVPQETLVFFDDHQNAFTRLQQCWWFGFEHILFEDNYPPQQGDCYSIKKAWMNSGFKPSPSQAAQPSQSFQTKVKSKIGQYLGLASQLPTTYQTLRVPPNDHDAKVLNKHLETYYEFPPVYQTPQTRWHAPWDENYPGPPPLLATDEKDRYPLFWEEAMFYTWICYVKLKSQL